MAQPPKASEPNLSDVARHAIEALFAAGDLPHGTVLLEGPIADRLGMSRAPVRTALQSLEKDGRAHRFDGRGYVLGDASDAKNPVRIDLREIPWPDVSSPTVQRRDVLASDTVLQELQTAIIGIISFGRFRISEAALAKTFGVSRAVAREALFHLLKRGLVDKDLRSHWITGPLTAQMTRDLFAMRAVLEPLALKQAAPTLAPDTLLHMRARLEPLLTKDTKIDVTALDEVERDLHDQCLADCGNPPLLATLAQTRLPAAANTSFGEAMGGLDAAAPLAEHAAILDALIDGDVEQACTLLGAHILASSDRTVRRLKLLSILPYPDLPDYITAAEDAL